MMNPVWRRRRVANTGLFVLTGLAMALWVVNIPAVRERTGATNSMLGMVLLLLGVGSVIGMQIAGLISDRRDSRRAAGIAVAVIVIAINLPAQATEVWHLAVALPLLGLGTGMITVAANDQAVAIQDAYGRPIMAAFHGYFSIAGAAGSGLGALFHALDVPLWGALGFASLAAALIGVVSVPGLLVPAEEPAPAPVEDHPTTGPEPSIIGPAVALAALALLLNLAEGTATDWSAVHAVEHLGLSQATASLAYGSFALAMTVGRLTIDRVVARVGPVRVVRYGSALAAAGIVVVVASPVFALTVIGWMVFGLGISGIVPQIFTAAGSLSVARRGVVLSRVVGIGYAGMLAGPAVVGWIADAVGIDRALLIAAFCCLAGVVLAGNARPRTVTTAPTDTGLTGARPEGGSDGHGPA